MTKHTAAPSQSALLVLEALTDAAKEREDHFRQSPQRRQEPGQGMPPEPDGHTLAELQLFQARLEHIRTWVAADPELLRIVDAHLGQHVRQAEAHRVRRERQAMTLTTAAGAVLGWLASALTAPDTLWRSLF
ncbi:hypothetical protein [Streptomyces sp. 2A115]|uniref:hypothetical protein n=1 Tax=Streptomyces sp. 2A115 TaxID=3457439 RepID=UPI003FCFCA79